MKNYDCGWNALTQVGKRSPDMQIIRLKPPLVDRSIYRVTDRLGSMVAARRSWPVRLSGDAQDAFRSWLLTQTLQIQTLQILVSDPTGRVETLCRY